MFYIKEKREKKLIFPRFLDKTRQYLSFSGLAPILSKKFDNWLEIPSKSDGKANTTLFPKVRKAHIIIDAWL